MNLIYGLVQISKNSKETLDFLKKIDPDSSSTLVVPFVGQFAKSRNFLIDEARKRNADMLVILEDNIVPKTIEVIQEYIDLMADYALKTIFYGFHDRNRILGKANPCVIVKVKEGREEFINRYACSSFMLIDLRGNPEKFDENLNAASLDEYLYRLYMLGYLPFYGFFFDVKNSWDKFEMAKDSVLLNFPKEIIEKDRLYFVEKKIDIKQEMNADALTAYLKKRWYGL